MTGADPQIPPAYARRWKVELCCDLTVTDLCLSVYLSSVRLSVVRPATYISHLSLWSQNGSGTETTNKTILIASLHLSKSVIWCRILFMIGYLIIYTLLSKETLDGMFSLISFILLIYVVKARVCYLFEKHFLSNWLNEEWGNEDWGEECAENYLKHLLRDIRWPTTLGTDETIGWPPFIAHIRSLPQGQADIIA